MRLVDHHPANAQLGEPFHEPWTPKSLGRQEHQPVIACDCPAEPIDLLGPLNRRVDERRGDAPPGKAVDLVLHERDQRRDDHRQSTVDDSRHPVADALPGPGGRDRKNVASRKHRRHDLCLAGAEFIKAENLAQHALCPVDHPGDSDRNAEAGPALFTTRPYESWSDTE